MYRINHARMPECVCLNVSFIKFPKNQSILTCVSKNQRIANKCEFKQKSSIALLVVYIENYRIFNLEKIMLKYVSQYLFFINLWQA